MTEQQPRLSAAFPPPPPYYKAFTPERLAAYRTWRAEHETDSPPTELAYLEPPPPPTSGYYMMFGEQWPVVDQVMSLKDAGIPQLYSEEANVNRAEELKRINRSLVYNFLELINILLYHPEQYPVKIDHFRLLLNNMYALINEYRPLQARETLKLMLKDQIERKKKATEDLLRQCQELNDIIEQAHAQIPTVQDEDPLLASVTEKTDQPELFADLMQLSENGTKASDEEQVSIVPTDPNAPELQNKLYELVVSIS